MEQSSQQAFTLSGQQKLLWSWLGETGGPVQASVSLKGQLDIPRLFAALHSARSRHEILRTTFRSAPGVKVPFQVVLPDAHAEIQMVDLRSVAASDQKARLDQLAATLAPVDFEKIPSLNACVASLSDDEHVLLLSLSPLCADSWTVNNLVLELSRSYAGQQVAEPLQYADYSSWQDELVQKTDEEAKAANAYWALHDYGAIPPLVLPFEGRPLASARFSPESVKVPLDGDVLARLVAAGLDAENCLLAAWQILLWRLTGQSEVVVSRIVSGRNHQEFADALGPFAKMVPEYSNFEEQEYSFAGIAKHAEQSNGAALAWLDYLPLDRTVSRSGVGFRFDHASALQTAHGLTFSIQDVKAYIHPFKLTLECRMEGDSGTARLVYDSAYLSGQAVERLAERLVLLLTAAAVNPNAPAATLPIMNAAERQQVLFTFNQAAVSYPHQCIHELFEEQAIRTPARPALRSGDRVFTYGDLNIGANRLAHVLRARGVTRNVPVGLLMERSSEMIVSLVGILKAGGCYVPLIPDHPQARLAHQLSESGARVVLTLENSLSAVPNFGGEVICLDRDRELLENAPSTNPDRISSPHDLVYIIYTSGSTGTPKGVAVSHSNLSNYTNYIYRRLGLDEHPDGLDFATVSTIAADLGNTAIFPALTSGGCLHVIDYETSVDARRFASYFANHPIDVLKITPSHLSALLDGAGAARALPRKYLVLGGEALSWGLLERIRNADAGCTVINHYGPTEATVGCCTFTPAENDVSAWAPASVPIGKPIANSQIFILDSHLLPVPVGVAGELCVAGAGLAQGYFNQPQQTAQKFVSSPFASDPASRLYRTGDLARFLPDGNIEFLGRADQQVKIRGFRVEPAEIVAALKEDPRVKEAVVIPHEDASADRCLAAYVVSTQGVVGSDLRASLQEKLPQYMIPAEFIVLESLPLTANGKVDMKSLPRLGETRAEKARTDVRPRNETEEALAEIWREVLRLEHISVTDNFFELGGHSLLATQIISRIRNKLHVQLPLPTFLLAPTIADIATQLPLCPKVDTEEEELAKLLEEIEGLSEEEAQQLLAATREGDTTAPSGP